MPQESISAIYEHSGPDTTIDVDERKIKLIPGMNVTAEIKTGKRRVIEYLLSPLQQRVQEGLRER